MVAVVQYSNPSSSITSNSRNGNKAVALAAVTTLTTAIAVLSIGTFF
jgi:hypothetical protein